MELIKKIKQAEAEAQEIIEQAKADTAREAEKEQVGRVDALTGAERRRKKAIEAAVVAAESEGLAEVEKLKLQAEKACEQLREKTEAKMAGVIAKVMGYLRG